MRMLLGRRVYSYMSPDAHEKLLPLLEAVMPIGGRVVTCAFPLVPEFITMLPEDQQNERWRLESSARMFDLLLYCYVRRDAE